jgi:GNAT superfamily N-acetyltransferase
MTTRSEITVRSWSRADRAAVIALNAELQDYERGLRPSRRPGAEMSESYVAGLEERFADPGEEGALYVAEVDGKIIGFATCFVGADELEMATEEILIHDLVVAAEARRRGAGQALIAAVRRFASERRITRVVVSVLTINEAASAMYQAIGFQPATVTYELSEDA